LRGESFIEAVFGGGGHGKRVRLFVACERHVVDTGRRPRFVLSVDLEGFVEEFGRRRGREGLVRMIRGEYVLGFCV
jgi:hypothetical protein